MNSLLVLVFATAVAVTHGVNYDGFKVYRLYPVTEEHQTFLTSLSESNKYDFWTPVRKNGEYVDVMINPKDEVLFSEALHSIGLEYEFLIHNVESIIHNQRLTRLRSPPLREGEVSFTKYLIFEEIQDYLQKLDEKYEHVSIESLGKSSEGRDLTLVKISTDPSANKPIIFIEGGIHSREWISPASVLYFIHQLAENPESADLLKTVDWHIITITNPDGYAYTFSNNRMWRKTRSHNRESPSCIGTDANRNFDFHWDQGRNKYPCEETYRGQAAFSEPETDALRKYVLEHKDNIRLYLSFHSYGNLILHSWGHKRGVPENVQELRNLAKGAAESIRAVSGTAYRYGSITDLLGYIATGSSIDWAKGVAGIELALAFELPGKNSGFLLPPRYILPVAEETWEGVKTLHDLVTK